MDDLATNNVICFKNISKKKDGIFANFKVKAIKNGVTISATISVDISALELHPGDSMEKIIEDSANLSLRELKKADFVFEGFDTYLGVAQLG